MLNILTIHLYWGLTWHISARLGRLGRLGEIFLKVSFDCTYVENGEVKVDSFIK